MDIIISKQNNADLRASVKNMGEIPAVVFAASVHHGGGTYIARDKSTNEPLFRMTTEWLEEDE
jgi:hypothetical protein